MNEKYKASVIIPTYNRAELLRKTIISLCNQNISKDQYEVLICDDGSEDETKNVVEKFSEKINIKYLFQEHNGFGAARARNMGIKNSQGKLCVFLDSGLIVSCKFIEEHIKANENDKDVVIGDVIGFSQYYIENSEFTDVLNCGKNVDEKIEILRESGFDDLRHSLYRRLGEDLRKWPAPWTILWSGNFSVKRNFLISIGLFDEWYNTWGGEDTDLGIQLYSNSGVYKLNRNAAVLDYPHKKESKKDEDEYFAYREQIKKRTYMYKKYKRLDVLAYIFIDTDNINQFMYQYNKLMEEGC